MERKKPSLRELINRRRAAFEAQTAYHTYTVGRGLYDREAQGKEALPLQGYARLLPKVEGETIDTLIKDRITQKGTATILDIGCGEGRFLLDCKSQWGDKIKTFGVSATQYHDTESVEAAGVEIGIGDAQSLLNCLRENGMPTSGYDFVVSVFAFPYIADPLAVLKHAHSILADNGIVMVDRFSSFDSSLELNFGATIDDRGIWFQKRIDLPSISGNRYSIDSANAFLSLGGMDY